METMKAVVCARYGLPDVLKIAQCQKPVPSFALQFAKPPADFRGTEQSAVLRKLPD